MIKELIWTLLIFVVILLTISNVIKDNLKLKNRTSIGAIIVFIIAMLLVILKC